MKTSYNLLSHDYCAILAGTKIDVLAAMRHIVKRYTYCHAYFVISTMFINLVGLAVSRLKDIFLDLHRHHYWNLKLYYEKLVTLELK